MATFLTPRSLLLLEHLGWTKEDMDFFLLPVDDLDKLEKFEHLCWFIDRMTIVNDPAECVIKLVKDRISTVHTEERLINTVVRYDTFIKAKMISFI